MSACRSTSEIMRPRFSSLRLLAPVALLGALLFVLWPKAATAQDDAPSLGDLARNLRKNKAQQPQPPSDPAQTVIDNDNLAQVMEDAKKARPLKTRQDRVFY